MTDQPVKTIPSSQVKAQKLLELFDELNKQYTRLAELEIETRKLQRERERQEDDQKK